MNSQTLTFSDDPETCNGCGHAVDDHDLRGDNRCNLCSCDPNEDTTECCGVGITNPCRPNCQNAKCDTCGNVATTTRTEGGSTPRYTLCAACATDFDEATR